MARRKKRTKRIGVSVTAREHALAKALAQDYGDMSVGTLVRMLLFQEAERRRIVPLIDGDDLGIAYQAYEDAVNDMDGEIYER
jgi:hypothetical protein